MPLYAELRQNTRALVSLVQRRQDENVSAGHRKSLGVRLVDVFLRTGDLGFTAFGV